MANRSKAARQRRISSRQRTWLLAAALLVGVPLGTASFAAGYYYVRFAALIDARLSDARTRVLPQMFARPLELRRGQALTPTELIVRLNDLGYTERSTFERPGEFIVGDGA